MAEETTPLLPSHLPPRNRHQYSWFLFLLCTVVVTLDFGASLSIAPQTQILENIICHNLHPNVAASSSLCKDIDVRSELALITGWKETFDQIPGIILALPYGFMADRIGRKRVVMLSLLGLMMQEVAIRVICWNALTIPPRAIWVTALFQVCGGGAQIGASMAYTILTDIYSVEQRTNKFFILAAAALTSEILANPISAWLMTVSSPWLPYLLSLFCEFVGVLAALSLPETLPKFLHGDEDSASSPQIADDEDRNRDDGIFETYFRPAWTQVLRIREFIWKDKNILAISCAFFVGNVGQQALRLMLQYVSKRFGWSMAEASILISLKGLITLFLLLILLPAISLLLSHRLPPLPKDLLIVRLSAIFLILGCTLMALAPSAAIFITGVCVLALGWGFYSALRAVASALVSEEHIGLLNTTIALVQGAGAVVAGPAMAGAFSFGMKRGGAWIGLPYLVGAGLFLGAGGLTGVVRVGDRGF